MAVAWTEPTLSERTRFLSLVRAGEPVDVAGASVGHSSSSFRRLARRDEAFRVRYIEAARAGGRHPGVVEKLEAIEFGKQAAERLRLDDARQAPPGLPSGSHHGISRSDSDSTREYAISVASARWMFDGNGASSREPEHGGGA